MTSIAAYEPAATSQRLAILSLSLGAFAIGASEFMIGGLLAEVATDLDVTIPLAGLLISGYALGVTVGGPLLTILTGRISRRNQLLLLVTIFICGNLLCAVAPSYDLLLGGRILGAFCHGAYYGAASVVAGLLVPSSHRARAVAMVSAGIMIANVIGVPCGTAIGQSIGWRAAFWGVSLFGAVAAAAILYSVPASLDGGRARLGAEARALIRPSVLGGMLLCLCFTMGLFSFFSYLTPMLTEVGGAPTSQVPVLLVLFGVGSTAGVLLGGRLADWRLRTSIAVAFAAQAATYAVVAGLASNLIAMYVLLPAVGFVAMAAVAPLKTLVLDAAADAPGLSSTATSGALNLGVAIGAALGATVIDAGFGYANLPLIGAGFALIGLILVRAGRGL
jgi:MFS transporter, DHA1 family, inner membrane transport protein